MTADVHRLVSLVRIGNSIHHLNKKSEQLTGLSLVQWCVLKQLIDMPGTAALALAKMVDVHPSTLTQTLKRLERKGHVFLMEDPKDSRKKVISITKQGQMMLAKMEAQMESWSRELRSLSGGLNQLNIILQSHISGNLIQSKEMDL